MIHKPNTRAEYVSRIYKPSNPSWLAEGTCGINRLGKKDESVESVWTQVMRMVDAPVSCETIRRKRRTRIGGTVDWSIER